MLNWPLSDTKVRLIFIGCWLLLASLHLYALIGLSFDWVVAGADAGITYLTLAISSLLISNILRYYRPAKDRYTYLLIWCLVLAGLWLLISNGILNALFSEKVEYLIFLKHTLPVRYGVGFLILGIIALISVVWYIRKEQQQQVQYQEDVEKLAREAELYKLRQQLQPHFLFNSLNSISALIGTRPEEARKMIYQLSEFLRGTLKKEEEQWVSLEEELQHLQLYLDIEKVRFGHRLNTSVSYDEACAAARLPAMLLQPMVENAIKFGLYDTTEGVMISLQCQVQEQMLKLSIQNPYDPQTARPRQGTGFGLRGVQRRLYLLFGRNDLLQTQAENNIFTTTLKIPQR